MHLLVIVNMLALIYFLTMPMESLGGGACCGGGAKGASGIYSGSGKVKSGTNRRLSASGRTTVFTGRRYRSEHTMEPNPTHVYQPDKVDFNMDQVVKNNEDGVDNSDDGIPDVPTFDIEDEQAKHGEGSNGKAVENPMIGHGETIVHHDKMIQHHPKGGLKHPAADGEVAPADSSSK